MEGKEFGKGLKKKLISAADTAYAKAKDTAKSIKLPKAEDIKENAIQKFADVKQSLTKKDKPQRAEKEEAAEIKVLSTRCAVKLIYYLMAADGEICHSEEEKYDAICKEFDPDFAQNKDSITGECQAQLKKATDPDDYYDVIRDGAEEAIQASKPTEDSFVTPKLLIWDLLTVAYSDDSYGEEEQRLIKYIARKTNIDRAVMLEMESSIRTILAIENELHWIKTTNRPYLTIEAMVNELEDRKAVIFDSIKELISK